MKRLALLVAVACASSTPVVQFETHWPERSHDYQATYDRWTRHARVYKDLVQAIDAWATLEAPEFRAAFVDERAREERLPDDVHAKVLAEEQNAASGGWDVELIVSTENSAWNDFAKPDSMWHLELVADGKATAAAKIVPDPRPRASLSIWFPSLNDTFHEPYVVTFPIAAIPPGTKRVQLRISSAQAQAEMIWNAAD